MQGSWTVSSDAGAVVESYCKEVPVCSRGQVFTSGARSLLPRPPPQGSQ